jgi:hypothetical protein
MLEFKNKINKIVWMCWSLSDYVNVKSLMNIIGQEIDIGFQYVGWWI